MGRKAARISGARSGLQPPLQAPDMASPLPSRPSWIRSQYHRGNSARLLNGGLQPAHIIRKELAHVCRTEYLPCLEFDLFLRTPYEIRLSPRTQLNGGRLLKKHGPHGRFLHSLTDNHDSMVAPEHRPMLPQGRGYSAALRRVENESRSIRENRSTVKQHTLVAHCSNGFATGYESDRVHRVGMYYTPHSRVLPVHLGMDGVLRMPPSRPAVHLAIPIQLKHVIPRHPV